MASRRPDPAIERFDAIVIGTGQSGPPLALRLAAAGRKTAILERKWVGGTCVNDGCIPTKTLIASARVAHLARRAADFGVVVDAPVSVDMARVKARKDAVVKQSIDGLSARLGGTANLELIHGHGRFGSARTVRVDERLLEAPQIFVNTGARAAVPAMPGLADIDFLTNTSMMEIDYLPEHLLIVGGSYIGLEFAQMMRRFGSRVTLIEKGPRLIAREDDEVSEAIRVILEAEGIAVRLNAECISVARHAGGVAVRLGCHDEPREIVGSQLLLAVGRRPNTDDLGCEHAGLELDERGYIVVDDQLRSNVPGIWAMGDANGRGAFTHTSYNDYEIVAANLLDGDPRRVSDRITAYALFIDPTLGRGGMTEREVRASGHRALAATMPMARVGRATERSETDGLMKIVVDADTQKILGAALLGIEGDEVIHSILDVMYAGAPYTVIQRAVHIHPTVSELVPTLLGELKPLV